MGKGRDTHPQGQDSCSSGGCGPAELWAGVLQVQGQGMGLEENSLTCQFVASFHFKWISCCKI